MFFVVCLSKLPKNSIRILGTKWLNLVDFESPGDEILDFCDFFQRLFSAFVFFFQRLLNGKMKFLQAEGVLASFDFCDFFQRLFFCSFSQRFLNGKMKFLQVEVALGKF